MHFCGNPWHDLPQLLLALPFVGTAIAYVRTRFGHRHSGNCEH